jgi:hypothetical protein
MRRLRIARWVLALSVLHAPSSFADPITFTHQGVGTVSIDGGRFFDLAFTITAMGDTLNRQSLGFGFFIDHTSASISIAGVGTFMFLVPTRTFVNNSFQLVGFSRGGAQGVDLFNGPSSPLMATWDMRSSIGPIAGTGELVQWGEDIFSSGGLLQFDDRSGPVIFTATTDAAPVPEPTTLTLVGLGLGAAGLARGLRRRRLENSR